MNAHLNDEQLTAWLLGESDPPITQHVETCVVCRAEATGLQDAISSCRESMRAAADRDELFWARQRLLTRQRLAPRHRLPFLRWAAAVAMALVVFAALFLARSPQPAHPGKDEPGDEALLQQVDQDIQRDYPQALAPAVLIDRERNSALSANAGGSFSVSGKKEQQQ
jgi:hypothetical protein